jgi:dsDNA-specific endonuclease/ATPase MutS2
MKVGMNLILSDSGRATYDYEKKFYNDHLESLQAMEKNYMTMAREVEKLQAQLMNNANSDRRAGILNYLVSFCSI